MCVLSFGLLYCYDNAFDSKNKNGIDINVRIVSAIDSEYNYFIVNVATEITCNIDCDRRRRDYNNINIELRDIN